MSARPPGIPFADIRQALRMLHRVVSERDTLYDAWEAGVPEAAQAAVWARIRRLNREIGRLIDFIESVVDPGAGG